MTRLVAALSMMLVLAACHQGDTGGLSGSLGSIYNHSHSSVRGRLYRNWIAVEYVHTSGAVPIRMSVERSAVDGQGTIDLLEHGYVGGRNADGRDTPRFISGSLTIRRVSMQADGRFRGRFRASYGTSVGDFALNGTFDVRLEETTTPGALPPEPETDASLRRPTPSFLTIPSGAASPIRLANAELTFSRLNRAYRPGQD